MFSNQWLLNVITGIKDCRQKIEVPDDIKLYVFREPVDTCAREKTQSEL